MRSEAGGQMAPATGCPTLPSREADSILSACIVQWQQDRLELFLQQRRDEAQATYQTAESCIASVGSDASASSFDESGSECSEEAEDMPSQVQGSRRPRQPSKQRSSEATSSHGLSRYNSDDMSDSSSVDAEHSGASMDWQGDEIDGLWDAQTQRRIRYGLIIFTPAIYCLCLPILIASAVSSSTSNQPQRDSCSKEKKEVLKPVWTGCRKAGRSVIKSAKKVARAFKGVLTRDSSSSSKGGMDNIRAAVAEDLPLSSSAGYEALLGLAAAQQAQGRCMAAQIQRRAPVDVPRPRLPEYQSERFLQGMRVIRRSALCMPSARADNTQVHAPQALEYANAPHSSGSTVNTAAATAAADTAVVGPPAAVVTHNISAECRSLGQGYTVVMSSTLLKMLRARIQQLSTDHSSACGAIARKGCALTLKQVMKFCKQLEALGYYVVFDATSAGNSLYLMPRSSMRSSLKTQQLTKQPHCLPCTNKRPQPYCIQGPVQTPLGQGFFAAAPSRGVDAVCVLHSVASGAGGAGRLPPCLASAPEPHLGLVPSWQADGHAVCSVQATQWDSERQLTADGNISFRQVVHQHGYTLSNQPAHPAVPTSSPCSLMQSSPRSITHVWPLAHTQPSAYSLLSGSLHTRSRACAQPDDHMEQRQHGRGYFSSGFTTSVEDEGDTDSLPDLEPCSSFPGSSCASLLEGDYHFKPNLHVKDVINWSCAHSRSGKIMDVVDWILRPECPRFSSLTVRKKGGLLGRLVKTVTGSMFACIRPQEVAA